MMARMIPIKTDDHARLILSEEVKREFNVPDDYNYVVCDENSPCILNRFVKSTICITEFLL